MTSHARSTDATDPRIGMTLQQRYRIVRKLGDGGMGSVYEAEHIRIKRRFAVKVLHAQFAANAEIVARFEREAEAATAIGHPNIIEVTDMGSFPDGTSYMVLEFLDGRDFANDISTQGPQPLGKLVHIVSQVCDALDAAHQKHIVHRDLKPENIYLIERAGDPNFAKILDFGISKFADPAAQDRSLTQTGTALGTPYYMAPEQCQGKKDVDSRADIYSLGVILFQALTGQYPFDDESYPMLVLKICTEAPPPIQQYRPDLPLEVVNVVNRMLSKNRENRFSTCAEVKAALAPFLQVYDAPVIAQNAPSTAARGPSVLDAAGLCEPGLGGSGPALTPTGTAYLPGTNPRTSAAPAEKSSSGLVIALVLALGFLLLSGAALGTAAALGLFASDSGEPTAGQDVDPVEPASPPEEPIAAIAAPPPEVVEPPAAPAAPEPAMYPVSITVTPPEATLRIDGRDVDNPYTGELSAGPHIVRASADGYVDDVGERQVEGPTALPIVLEQTPRAVRGRRSWHDRGGSTTSTPPTSQVGTGRSGGGSGTTGGRLLPNPGSRGRTGGLLGHPSG